MYDNTHYKSKAYQWIWSSKTVLAPRSKSGSCSQHSMLATLIPHAFLQMSDKTCLGVFYCNSFESDWVHNSLLSWQTITIPEEMFSIMHHEQGNKSKVERLEKKFEPLGLQMLSNSYKYLSRIHHLRMQHHRIACSECDLFSCILLLCSLVC